MGWNCPNPECELYKNGKKICNCSKRCPRCHTPRPLINNKFMSQNRQVISSSEEIMKVAVEDVEFPFGFELYDIRKYLLRTIKNGLLEDIRKNGIQTPIFIRWNPRTNKWTVVNGKHRVIVAKHLGISIVEAIEKRNKK